MMTKRTKKPQTTCSTTLHFTQQKNCRQHAAFHPTEKMPQTSDSFPTGECSHPLQYCYTYSCSKEQDIYVGAHYDPHLLSDYGSNLFHHHAVKLLQHDMRNVDLHLILPWEYYNKLHSGTMVLCDVTLHLYQMAIMNAKGHQQKMRKV